MGERQPCEILILQCNMCDTSEWNGHTVGLLPAAEATLTLSNEQILFSVVGNLSGNVCSCLPCPESKPYCAIPFCHGSQSRAF